MISILKAVSSILILERAILSRAHKSPRHFHHAQAKDLLRCS
jgi:hypothetical protein